METRRASHSGWEGGGRRFVSSTAPSLAVGVPAAEEAAGAQPGDTPGEATPGSSLSLLGLQLKM